MAHQLLESPSLAAPAWLESLVTPFCTSIGFNQLPGVLHIALFACAASFSLQFLSRVVCPVLFPQTYPKLKVKQDDWDLHVVSHFGSSCSESASGMRPSADAEDASLLYYNRLAGHMLSSPLPSPLVLSCTLRPASSRTRSTATVSQRVDSPPSPRVTSSGCVGAAACWMLGADRRALQDTIVSAKHMNTQGLGFFLHGAGCGTAFLFTLKPFLMFCGPNFLIVSPSSTAELARRC